MYVYIHMHIETQYCAVLNGLTIEAGLVGEGEIFPSDPGNEGCPCDDIL